MRNSGFQSSKFEKFMTCCTLTFLTTTFWPFYLSSAYATFCFFSRPLSFHSYRSVSGYGVNSMSRDWWHLDQQQPVNAVYVKLRLMMTPIHRYRSNLWPLDPFSPCDVIYTYVLVTLRRRRELQAVKWWFLLVKDPQCTWGGLLTFDGGWWWPGSRMLWDDDSVLITGDVWHCFWWIPVPPQTTFV